MNHSTPCHGVYGSCEWMSGYSNTNIGLHSPSFLGSCEWMSGYSTTCIPPWPTTDAGCARGGYTHEKVRVPWYTLEFTIGIKRHTDSIAKSCHLALTHIIGRHVT